MNWPVILITGSVIAVGLYLTQWPQRLYSTAKTKLKRKLTQIVIQEFDQQAHSQSTDSFRVSSNQKACTITFEHAGKLETVTLPYDRSLISKTSGCKLWLIDQLGTRVLMNHKLGIPYLLTAKDLDGQYYEIERHGQIRQLSPEELPFQTNTSNHIPIE